MRSARFPTFTAQQLHFSCEEVPLFATVPYLSHRLSQGYGHHLARSRSPLDRRRPGTVAAGFAVAPAAAVFTAAPVFAAAVAPAAIFVAVTVTYVFELLPHLTVLSLPVVQSICSDLNYPTGQ